MKSRQPIPIIHVGDACTVPGEAVAYHNEPLPKPRRLLRNAETVYAAFTRGDAIVGSHQLRAIAADERTPLPARELLQRLAEGLTKAGAS